MRTPAGKECQYFYADYYRGRNHQECRLLGDASPALKWEPALCETCPAPEIQLANACQHMLLIPRLDRPFPFLRRQVRVSTSCPHSGRSDFDPHIGCGKCHELPFTLSGDVIEQDPAG
jgi:hypothetical protein